MPVRGLRVAATTAVVMLLCVGVWLLGGRPFRPLVEGNGSSSPEACGSSHPLPTALANDSRCNPPANAPELCSGTGNQETRDVIVEVRLGGDVPECLLPLGVATYNALGNQVTYAFEGRSTLEVNFGPIWKYYSSRPFRPYGGRASLWEEVRVEWTGPGRYVCDLRSRAGPLVWGRVIGLTGQPQQ